VPGSAAMKAHAERGCKALGFTEPVVGHGRRRHHQRGPFTRAVHQQRERLERLAEAHVVREHGARLDRSEPREPPEPRALILAKCPDERRRYDWLGVIDITQALANPLPSGVGAEIAIVLDEPR
jgi:hypothetical protein